MRRDAEKGQRILQASEELNVGAIAPQEEKRAHPLDGSTADDAAVAGTWQDVGRPERSKQ